MGVPYPVASMTHTVPTMRSIDSTHTSRFISSSTTSSPLPPTTATMTGPGVDAYAAVNTDGSKSPLPSAELASSVTTRPGSPVTTATSDNGQQATTERHDVHQSTNQVDDKNRRWQKLQHPRPRRIINVGTQSLQSSPASTAAAADVPATRRHARRLEMTVPWIRVFSATSIALETTAGCRGCSLKSSANCA